MEPFIELRDEPLIASVATSSMVTPMVTSMVATAMAASIMLLFFHFVLHEISKECASEGSQHSVPSKLMPKEGTRCSARQ